MSTTMDFEVVSGAKAESPPGLLSGRYRLPTTGIVLVITLLAFEAMSVGTVMPVVAADLHGLSLYGWSFSAFLIASMLGTVLSGSWIDRAGPARPLLIGIAVFVAGLAISGVAPSMLVFVLGRTVQGAGAGIAIVGIYVMVARVYPEEMRPRVFGATATAWVVPSLVGPALGGFVAEHLHWRWVFLGLIPLVIPAAAMLMPALRNQQPDDEPPSSHPGRVLAAIAAAAGAGALLYAVDHTTWVMLPVAIAGLAALGFGVPRLLPAGAMRLRRGLPTTVVMRGLLAGAFFGTDVFIPLALTELHHFRPTEAGIVLTVGALGWSAAAQIQGRSQRPRAFFVLFGSVLVAVAVVFAAVALQLSGWWAVPAWIIGGAGMGLAFSSLGVLVLSQSAPGEQGVNSAALQLCDTLCSSVSVGVAGALVTAFGADRLGLGLGVAAVPLIAIALFAVLAATRVSTPEGAVGGRLAGGEAQS